jgi:alkanesulfonate monooxygenase SsuD/methylene tetrahydromethanopterin reductase-like flavin-dependent oxidoreductase (luciferase family)
MYRDLSRLKINELKDFVTDLELSGYYSILTIYNSNQHDGWIKAAHIINKNEKIKYNIAIRPHVISPEYCIMMCRSFNNIQPNRLMINFVVGVIKKDEDDFITKEDRVINFIKFIENFNKKNNGMAEIAVSGSSDIVIDLANQYADVLFTEYSAYRHVQKSINGVKKIGLIVKVCIRNTDEEAESFIEKMGEKNWDPRFYGAYEKIKKNIIDINKLNVSDIMISPIPSDDNIKEINRLVKEISGLS